MSGTIQMTSDQLADLIRRAFATDGWMTIAEAAAYMRTSVVAVYKWVKEGKLTAYAPSGTRIVRRRDLDLLARRARVDAGERDVRGENGTAHLARAREQRAADLEKATAGEEK